MKISKKILAVICSLTLIVSMAVSVQATDTLTDPVSLILTDNTTTDNTVKIDVKVDTEKVSLLNGSDICLKVPVAIKDYITGWTFSTPFASSVMTLTPNTDWVEGYTTTEKTDSVITGGYVYIKASLAMAGTDFGAAVPSDGIYLSATLTLAEGGIPATVAEADRTITIGADYAGSNAKYRKAASTLTTATTSSSQTYYFKTSDSDADKIASKTYFDFDITAEGNYVVIPVAGPTEVIPTATTTGKQNGVKIGDGYTGDTDATDMAAAVGVGVLGDGNVHNELLWEVTADIEGTSVTKTHKSTVSVDGDAAYKFGLVIQGLAQSAITAVTAVLQ